MTQEPAPTDAMTWRNARKWASANRTTGAGTRLRAVRCSTRAAHVMRRRSSVTRRRGRVIVAVLVAFVAFLVLNTALAQSTPSLSSRFVFVGISVAGFVAWWTMITASAVRATHEPGSAPATATITVVRGHGCIEVTDWAYLPHEGPVSLIARRAAYDLGASLLTWADEREVVLVASAASPTLAAFYRDCGFTHTPTREHHAGRVTRIIGWLMPFQPALLRYPGTPLPDPDRAFTHFAR
ncbi:hypothetical protein OG921_24395 [Aldersonia sp. NBC_00410]|uniref:hypothetical protein n=1 Tax=Aldersonia sp. NBC_00410 TaxID=2975954 RepID=UPI0022517474|nr:hypothetical protein [Aldersonia sp. NBC_00410]MCX5044830.1 hypothetical protein [Aldersonia sp. NBC_00410]MCX5046317.1 hypothetical protein [Aldersonia sp. NBC_00410]